MNIIGIAGVAGAGKDTAANALVENYGFVKVSLADPLKRICKEVFGFTDEQLWGPSEMRNQSDERWPHTFAGSVDKPREWLTPRYALQTLGTEWGRACSPNVWVDYAIRAAERILNGWSYFPQDHHNPFQRYIAGEKRAQGIVVPDVRFSNEVDAIRSAGGHVWLVDRPGAGLSGSAGQHASETGIASLHVDAAIRNAGTIQDLRATVGALMMIGVVE
jgi:Deoxynucleotide monophosphate kinase